MVEYIACSLQPWCEKAAGSFGKFDSLLSVSLSSHSPTRYATQSCKCNFASKSGHGTIDKAASILRYPLGQWANLPLHSVLVKAKTMLLHAQSIQAPHTVSFEPGKFASQELCTGDSFLPPSHF